MPPFLPHLLVNICLAPSPVLGAGRHKAGQAEMIPGLQEQTRQRAHPLVKQNKTDKKEVALTVKSLPYPTRIKLPHRDNRQSCLLIAPWHRRVPGMCWRSVCGELSSSLHHQPQFSFFPSSHPCRETREVTISLLLCFDGWQAGEVSDDV